MPLVYAAVTPHAPVLAPTLATEHHAVVEPTISALRHIGQELRAAHVDVVIVLSPHATGDGHSFFAYTGETLAMDLSAFGDFKTATSLPGATVFAQHLRSQADHDHVPMQLQTSETLDYAVSIPWLAGAWPTLPCLPIATYGQSDELLYRFGELLGEVCHQQSARVAIIASADLAQREATQVEPDRPMPWEREIATAIREGQRDTIPAPTETDPCGRAPIVALLSALSAIKPTGTILSFQAPFRVGYLTAECHLRR